MLLSANTLEVNIPLKKNLDKLYPKILTTNDFEEIHKEIPRSLRNSNYSTDSILYFIVKSKDIKDIIEILDKNKCFYSHRLETNDTHNIIKTTALEYQKILDAGIYIPNERTYLVNQSLKGVAMVFFNKSLSAIQIYSPLSDLQDTEFNRESYMFRGRLGYNDVNAITQQYLNVPPNLEYFFNKLFTVLEYGIDLTKKSLLSKFSSEYKSNLDNVMDIIFKSNHYKKDDNGEIAINLTGWVETYPEKFKYLENLFIKNNKIINSMFSHKIRISRLINDTYILRIKPLGENPNAKYEE